MINNSIINGYSGALFELLKEKKDKKILEQIKFLKVVLETENELNDFLSSKFYSIEDRKSVVDKIFKNKLDIYLINFIYLLIDNNIFESAKDIVNKTIFLLNKKYHIKFALIESAFELSNEQIKNIVNALSTKYKSEIDYKVVLKPSLIGGIKIKIENDIIDGSIKNKLENIKNDVVKS